MLRSERRGLSQSYSITTFIIHENMLPGIFIFLVTGKRFPSKVIRSTEYL